MYMYYNCERNGKRFAQISLPQVMLLNIDYSIFDVSLWLINPFK